jgi:hypothetical protein
MSSIQIGIITLSKSQDNETINASVATNDQEEFENALHDLIGWLQILKVGKIVFQAGGNLIIPNWFLDACRQAGIHIEVRASNAEIDRVVNALDELTSSILALPESASEFFGSCIEDAARELRHGHHRHNEVNPFWVIDIYRRRGASNYEELALNSLKSAYHVDENRLISDVCGSLYGNCPKNKDIKELLLQGIFNTEKSNRLRERFFLGI